MIKSTNPFFDNYVLVEYEFSTLCNKDCSYCYNMFDTDVRSANPLDVILSDITSILTVDNPYIILNLIGGEIMVHPNFKEIIYHIAKVKKPETRVILYTHADHRVSWYKERIDYLKVFGDKVKLHCTIHLEDLNLEQFRVNMQYTNDNFPYLTLYLLVDDALLEQLDFIKSLLDTCEKLKLYALLFDGNRGFDLIKQLGKFKRLEDISDRMDNTFTLSDGEFPQSSKLMDVYKDTNFNFYGNQCTLMVYEVDRNGDYRKSCDNVVMGNIRDNDKSMFDLKTITCPNTRCMESLSNLDVN